MATPSPTPALPSVDISWLNDSPKKRERRKPVVKRPRAGQPAVHEQFPEIIKIASTYVQSNGFKAHRRRQESTGTAGSTLGNIRQHLFHTVPGLREKHPNLGSMTIARWMKPPNRVFNSSSTYTGLIDARVPAKNNSARKVNDNSHFYSARVRYFLECASKFNQEVLVYSADNKNKIKVGDATLAVDRRIQISRFFPTNDVPIYSDHDFPTPGYLLTPSGYLEMDPSSNSTLDHLGREHYELPQNSSPTVFLQSPRTPCNITSHMNNLSLLLDAPAKLQVPQKSVLMLLVDGGPDFNVNHTVNAFHYGRFFRDFNLDALLVTSYCPGDSAMNPIEHLWAPCTRSLTSVYLPASLDEDGRPPCHLTRISAEEKLDKEHRVFDRAMNLIKDRYWADVRFSGHQLAVHTKQSGAAPHPYGKDYEDIKTALNGSLKQLRDKKEIHKELKFVVGHMDRRIGSIIFTKCKKCDHCKSNPPRSSAELMDCLKNFPSPQPSTSHKGHFITFKESLASPLVMPCMHMPLYNSKGLGRCNHPGCKYVFNSAKDVTDHRRKIHS